MRKLFVLAVAALLVAFALPAGAGDFSFFGRVHVETYWTDTDNPGTALDTTDLTWDNSNWSYFGANIKVTDEKIEPAADKREDDGIISWKLSLAPREKTEIRIAYTISFPNDMAESDVMPKR